MPCLLHLNGPPGIGKSTIARRYAEEHPGVLNCDVDVLRMMIGGWADDFQRAGVLIRPAALGMIEGYLASGHDVVFPQLLVDPAEIALFEACATRANARFVERVLMDERERAVARFHSRGDTCPEDPWHTQVKAIVADQGGDDALRNWHAAVGSVPLHRRNAVVVQSRDGCVEETYRRLLASLCE